MNKNLTVLTVLAVAALLGGGCGSADSGTVAPITPKSQTNQVKAGGAVQQGGVFDAVPDPAPPGVVTGTK